MELVDDDGDRDQSLDEDCVSSDVDGDYTR